MEQSAKYGPVEGGFICPVCKVDNYAVLESRRIIGGVRRRRSCMTCQHRLTTIEISHDQWLKVQELEGFKAELIDQLQGLINRTKGERHD